MKCSIVSFITIEKWTPEINARLVSNLLNQRKQVDLILFSGWTLFNKSDLLDVLKNNNKHTTFILEIGASYPNNSNPEEGFYIVKGKSIVKGPIKQLFANSSEANRNENNLISNYLSKLETERCFKVNNKRVRLIICGENNILKNRQKENNKVYFRSDDKELKIRFESILENTDIFLNSAHTPMGNLGKLKKRWAYLSKDSRACLFTTNECNEKTQKSDPKKSRPNLYKSSLQYIFIDGGEKEGLEEVRDKFKITTIEIK